MNNCIEINGNFYAIDLHKIMDFINQSQDVTQTINQTYGIPLSHDGVCVSDFQLVNKEVSEIKSNGSEFMANIRYNLITNFLNLVLLPISDGDSLITVMNKESMHVGQRFAFNTLYEMGIIYEIGETEE